jgi:hypothetical protein
MNIELFNKQLAIKVAKATNLEKRGDLKSAINAWLEVSDMSIGFSKSRGIESTFRNMLIKRTEKIVEHIKSLKKELIEPEITLEESTFIEEDPESQELDAVYQKIENLRDSINGDINTNNELPDEPGGFVEIKASKDFKIVTPHEELDMDIFKENKTVALPNDDDSNISKGEQDQLDLDKTSICFACGYDKNPPNAKTCKNCNIELK